MDMTIGKLRIGAPLVMGKYGVNNDTPYPIVWLKGTPNGDFITKDAVDFLPFDAREIENTENDCRYLGNADYKLCNLLQFLNSVDESWFNPTHAVDSPPIRNLVDYSWLQYDTHFGFLYYFDDHEVAAIQPDMRIVNDVDVSTLIRLPSSADILGDDRFKLFAKKGIRPNGTEDMVHGKPHSEFTPTSYIPFWISDRGRGNNKAAFISRSGVVESTYPLYGNGVRPVCTLRPDVQVVLGGDGLYYIKPPAVNVNTFTDEELFAFLGMAQP